MTPEHVRFEAGDIHLAGLLELPADEVTPVPAVVVCHPHPRYGGDMYNDVVSVICRAVLETGAAALRFDFRGAGGSSGEHTGGVGERDDVWAALDYLRGRPEVDRRRLGLAGYSFGAGVALNAGPAAGVKALAAVSVPPRMLDFGAMQGFEIPVLLLSGGRDEHAPAEQLDRLAIALGPFTERVSVAGADHFWGGHDAELCAAIGGFFSRRLIGAPEGRP